jgi:hypothetical protein
MADFVGEHRRDRRRGHAATIATEQRLPEPGFKRGDMAADCTVGQAAFGRCRRIAARPGGDFENTQGIKGGAVDACLVSKANGYREQLPAIYQKLARLGLRSEAIVDISMTAEAERPQPARAKPRNLLAACFVHALHDGYTDGLYAFLPIWQSQFGLSYAGLAVVRALYYGTMGGLQLPADRLLRRVTPRAALILATLIAVACFVLMALPLGFAGLCIGLLVAGVGSSIQHPRGSMLVTETYGASSRRPLGIYNFSGDLGKATLPALAALLLPLLAWRPVLGLMALLGSSRPASCSDWRRRSLLMRMPPSRLRLPVLLAGGSVCSP